MLTTQIDNFPLKRGKVRDVYDLGETLVIISTDRISCFDYVLPTPIPNKGKVLTQMSLFWNKFLNVKNHFISDNIADLPVEFRKQHEALEGRTMLVRKTSVVPFECIVRSYLTGSGWNEYKSSGKIGDIELPTGLKENSQFPKPIFTPSTKEEQGHDINISFGQMKERLVGKMTFIEENYGKLNASLYSNVADEVKRKSLEVFTLALEYAWNKGIIIADTKFEWGQLPKSELLLIDEVLTPDSSRFWPLSEYKLGSSMPSYDKQYVRDWLVESGWDKNSNPPELPKKVVEKTSQKYQEAYYRLTGKTID